MTIPGSQLYKDANADSKFCSVAIDTVVNYLDQFDKELGEDGKKTYNDRMLLFFRICEEDYKICIKSRCAAEFMKTEYDIDVSFTRTGEVIESQCECGAGMGPNGYCKHICAVLFKFSTTGTLKLVETCTQKLQSFHKCKIFVGSPLKASYLTLQGADEFTSVDYHPRLTHLRNKLGYFDYFRNTCMNFPGISNMPIFQLFKPANTLAAAKDHDYLSQTPEDNFLEAIMVTKITSEERQNIEKRTLGQSGNPQWFEERTKRLPSSMFGRICKAMTSDKTDKHKLAETLVEVTKIKTPALEHGRKYEDMAISAYMSASKNDVKKCGLVVASEKPFLACSPDGVIDK